MVLQSTNVIVGLGNPGPRYVGNRHNVGFMVVEALACHFGLAWGQPTAAYVVAAGPHCTLLKPLTFMNCSGEALAAWAADEGVQLGGEDPVALPGDVPGEVLVRPLVVCDDLNLPLGSVRFRERGRSGGQNGLKSVIGALGGSEFPRLRLGVGPLGEAVPTNLWPSYVLADFGDNEGEAVTEMIAHATEGLAFWVAHDLDGTASRFNRRVRDA